MKQLLTLREGLHSIRVHRAARENPISEVLFVRTRDGVFRHGVHRTNRSSGMASASSITLTQPRLGCWLHAFTGNIPWGKGPGYKNDNPSFHYYRAHVADLGEPAGCGNKQKPYDQCAWRPNDAHVNSAEVGICELSDDPVIIPWPLDDKFGYKGGQACGSFEGCETAGGCGECPDYYSIEIFCNDNIAAAGSAANPIIYKVGDFITGGNHQIHPAVGTSCYDEMMSTQ